MLPFSSSLDTPDTTEEASQPFGLTIDAPTDLPIDLPIDPSINFAMEPPIDTSIDSSTNPPIDAPIDLPASFSNNPPIDPPINQSIPSLDPGTQDPTNSYYHPLYRATLKLKGINVLYMALKIPIKVLHISKVIHDIVESVSEEKADNWPFMRHRLTLLSAGCSSTDVLGFLIMFALPNPEIDPPYNPTGGLIFSQQEPIAHRLMPSDSDGTPLLTPTPDRLYGYPGFMAKEAGGMGTSPFSFVQLETLYNLVHPDIASYAMVTTGSVTRVGRLVQEKVGMDGVWLPFFILQCNDTQHNIWGVENQCAITAFACLSVISQLNRAIIHAEAVRNRSRQALMLPVPTGKGYYSPVAPPPVDEFIYCMIVEPTIAVLYVAWKDKTPTNETPSGMPYMTHMGVPETCYLTRIDQLVLSIPHQLNGVQRMIKAILAWGGDTRLRQIKTALDYIHQTSVLGI